MDLMFILIVLLSFLGETLYYWRHKGSPNTYKTEVVCGADRANLIFKDFHASSTGSHCGQIKTREPISSRLYWPGMSVDINNWVSNVNMHDINTNDLFLESL